MPLNTTPNGLSVRIPGVYSTENVVSSLPGPLPEFNVPVLLGSAEMGYPYNVKDSMDVSETRKWYELCGTASKVATQYGQDSDLATIAKYAFRHGLPQGYFVCLSALTRAGVLATSTGPINQMTIYSKLYGWPGGWIKLSWNTDTLVVQPPRYFTRLTANAGATDTKVYVKDNSWMSKGMSVEIGDNATANSAKTISETGTEIDSNGQRLYWVRFTAAVGGTGFDVADSGAIAYYADTLKETPAAFADGSELLEWLQNDSEYLYGVAHANFSNALLIDVASLTAIKDISAWSTVTVGTSPAATATDVSNFITDLDQSEWDAFIEETGRLPRAFYLGMSSSTAHASMRDFATAKRADTEFQSISVMSGTAWGDTDLTAGDDTDPGYRATVLNSQDFALCAGGIDKLDAYLSFGPAVFGIRCGNGIPHNLTNDTILYEELETKWDERTSGEQTLLTDKGVCFMRLSNSQKRYVVSQGLSTLQNNDSAWNELSDDTCLLMQRDNADFVDRIIKEDLDTLQVGADKVTAASVAGVVARRAEKSLIKRGLAEEFRINSVTLNESGAGWDVDWSVRLPVTADFINVTTNVLIG